jgi:hypothetical protein
VRFGGEIITQLDVRQARMLKLVKVANDTDDAYVEALVNRRLILSDLKRTPAAEPSNEAVDAECGNGRAGLGPGANVPDLLDRAGMTDAGLRGGCATNFACRPISTSASPAARPTLPSGSPRSGSAQAFASLPVLLGRHFENRVVRAGMIGRPAGSSARAQSRKRDAGTMRRRLATYPCSRLLC